MVADYYGVDKPACDGLHDRHVPGTASSVGPRRRNFVVDEGGEGEPEFTRGGSGGTFQIPGVEEESDDFMGEEDGDDFRRLYPFSSFMGTVGWLEQCVPGVRNEKQEKDLIMILRKLTVTEDVDKA